MQKKITIVEDNELNLKLYQYMLRKIDAEIKFARDGQEALNIITTDPPDLVLLDIQIPGISGLDVIQKLRQMPEFAALPVIAVTAYSMVGDREKILAAGCTEYVSKPIDTHTFPDLITKYLTENTPL
jgi:two-component system cell cycle response regulator DivK